MTNLDSEALALYRRSRELYLVGRVEEAEIVYRSLRRDHGCELFYEVDLPVRLRLIHPVGCVLGRADYRGALIAYQCSGVGGDLDGNHPVIGDGVVLFPGARVLGRTVIGNNVFITANTVVQDVTVPDNSVVYPKFSDWTLGHDIRGCAWRKTKRSVMAYYFPEAK